MDRVYGYASGTARPRPVRGPRSGLDRAERAVAGGPPPARPAPGDLPPQLHPAQARIVPDTWARHVPARVVSVPSAWAARGGRGLQLHPCRGEGPPLGARQSADSVDLSPSRAPPTGPLWGPPVRARTYASSRANQRGPPAGRVVGWVRVGVRVFFPTRHPKPEHSGSGKPDRFHRLPVEICQIQI